MQNFFTARHFDVPPEPVHFTNVVIGLLLGLSVGIGLYNLSGEKTASSDYVLLFNTALFAVLFPICRYRVWRRVTSVPTPRDPR